MTRFRKGLLVAAVVGLAFATTALAGSGVGGVFNLGQTNSVNGMSVLTGTTAGTQLKVANASTASGTLGVLGQSASATGAGVEGVNLGGGPALQASVTTYFLPATGTAANSAKLNGFGSTVYSHRAIPANEDSAPRDTTGDVGLYTSATIGQEGLGLISYYDATNQRLKVLHCANLACTSGSVSIVDSGDVGQYSSIAIGADGLGLISYFDHAHLALKVAHCSNVACTSSTKTTLDSSVGGYTSITISGDGYGLISYYSTQGGGSLKVAHCTNVLCTGANTYTVDSGGGVSTKGLYTSITTVGYGVGLISYYDLTNGDLKTASCDNYACSSFSTSTVDNSADDVGRWTSITVGADGLGLIGYQDVTDGQIEVAHCTSLNCGAVTIKDVNSGTQDSITLGADGLPELSYYESGDLALTHCADADCSSSSTFSTTTTGQFGQYTGITIGADGFPLISFYDGGNGDLWVTHCPNPYCNSYFRRR